MSYIIKEGTLHDLLSIEHAIPEFSSPKALADINAKIDRHSHLLLVAYVNEKPVAYKLGYAKSAEKFYSWLGAVLPEFRGQGIAKALLIYQEAYVRSCGYKTIEVRSMNCFKRMLQMLIAHNYQIVNCERLDDDSDSKITFRKNI
jgi:ribosomal protein S18 acetylase RimI-like enzyme